MVASAAINSMSSVATSSSNNFIAPFTLEKASSTEFRSEDYGGKNVQEHQHLDALSIMTTLCKLLPLNC